MTRPILALLGLAILAPDAAFAFCGGWDLPVALGFDGASWGEKWPVLAGILGFVGVISTLVVGHVRSARRLPPEEA